MISGTFKSLDELNKAYSDHIESLTMWGGEFDREGLMDEWTDARIDFVVNHS